MTTDSGFTVPTGGLVVKPVGIMAVVVKSLSAKLIGTELATLLL